MGVFFSGREMINIAVEIEKNGFAFYTALARKSAVPASRRVFTYLAEQEEKHRAIFEEMWERAGRRPLDSLSEDYDAYLKALVDSVIFTGLDNAAVAAGRAGGEADALKLGIRAEKDSILFYQEMRDLVRRADRNTVSEIITEERSHLARLTALSRGSGKNRP